MSLPCLIITIMCAIRHFSRQNNPPLESALAARRSAFYRGGFILPAQQHCYVSGLQHCDGSDAFDAAATSTCGSTDAGLASIPNEDAPRCDTTHVCATPSSASSTPMPTTANVTLRRSHTFPCVHATEVLVLQNAVAAAQCVSSPSESPNESISTNTSISSSACNAAAAASSSNQAALHENAAAGAMSIAQRVEAVRRAWLSIPHE